LLLRDGFRIGLARRFGRGLLVLLPLQLLCEPIDLELLRGQSIFQSLDISSCDCGRCWCGGGGSVLGGWSG
jgi:hypothetical protein